eukprot:4126126-Prymnesium_polylepis.1
MAALYPPRLPRPRFARARAPDGPPLCLLRSHVLPRVDACPVRRRVHARPRAAVRPAAVGIERPATRRGHAVGTRRGTRREDTEGVGGRPERRPSTAPPS